jgi:hypothetical protein
MKLASVKMHLAPEYFQQNKINIMNKIDRNIQYNLALTSPLGARQLVAT